MARRVGIAEEHKVGGTCVIRGCVPKKLLVYGAHFAEDLDDAAMFGWDVPRSAFDWPRCCATMYLARSAGWKAYTETLTNHDGTIFKERATLTGPNSVSSLGQDVIADKILIATGAARWFRTSGHRACDQLERDLPPRQAAEAHRHRRRRLHRQRVRRNLPPVRSQVTLVNRTDADPAWLRRAGPRPPAADLDPQGHRLQVQRDLRGHRKGEDGSLSPHDWRDDIETDVPCSRWVGGRTSTGSGCDEAGVELDEKAA